MATPIKETPVLYGKDARKFIEDNKNVKKISKEEKARIEESYKYMMSISKF